MRYRITPGNILFLIMIGAFIYSKINPGDARDQLGAGYILFFSFFVILGDLVLQRIIKNYKILLLVEFVLIVVLIGSNMAFMR